MNQDIIPNKLDLLKFIDNVSHSNSQGLQTYPQSGYRPDNFAVFENHSSFRNRVSGIFFHAGGCLSVKGGYLSDNPVGIDIDHDHSDVISDTVIVGLSASYQHVLDQMGAAAKKHPSRELCTGSMFGVRIDSFHSGSLFGATGSHLTNLNISGFENCGGSSVLHVDDSDVRYFDTRNRIESIRIMDKSPPINLCDAEPQVAIRDIDGSSSGGAPGFWISDNPAIRAHPDCISGPEQSCASFCPNVCLRTMTVMVPSFYERGSLVLKVSGTLDDGREITPIKVLDFQSKEELAPKQESSYSRFFVTLPAGGNFTGGFFDQTGNPLWPLYTDLKYEDVDGSCGPDFASFEIEELSSNAQCNGELIQNGSFELGSSESWRYVGTLGLEVSNDGYGGSGHSLKAPNALGKGGGPWVGLGQYLDTRCVEANYVMHFSAQVKMTNSSTGAQYECNLSGYSSDPASCPRATIRFVNRLTDSTDWVFLGALDTSDQEWNQMTGSFRVSESHADANAVFFYISGVPADVDIQIDDVSLIRSEITPMPTALPTTSPSPHPSASPSTAPTVSSSTSPPAEVYEASSSESVHITANADRTASINFESSSGQNAAVLSSQAYQGDIELIVTLESRIETGDGYQPQLVLFIAPECTAVEDVTIDENNWNFFEGSVLSWAKEKIHNDIEHTWFTFRTKEEDGNFVSGSAGVGQRLFSGFSLKIQHSGGKVSSFYSVDYSHDTGTGTWISISTDMALPTEYQSKPLKLGYGIKREWKSVYSLSTSSLITSSGGPSDGSACQSDQLPLSYFDGSNADVTSVGSSVTCTAMGGCTIMGGPYDPNAALLSSELFEDDVTLTISFLDRPMFGTGYQAGIWLFFVPADAALATVADLPQSDGAFRDLCVATVGDKVHATIDHTWLASSFLNADGSSVDQSSSESWKNTNGYMRLQRKSGIVQAFVSPDGNSWNPVGAPKTLPLAMASAPLRLGFRVQKNWAPEYKFHIMTRVDTSEVIL